MRANLRASIPARPYQDSLSRSLKGVLTAKWASMSWTFLRLGNRGDKTIIAHWSFPVNIGISSESYPHLIELFKLLLACLLANKYHQSLGFNVRSVESFMVGARGLFRWMVTNDVQDFSQLKPEICKRYLQDLPYDLLNPPTYRLSAGTLEQVASRSETAANIEFAVEIDEDEWGEGGESSNGLEAGDEEYGDETTATPVKATPKRGKQKVVPPEGEQAGQDEDDPQDARPSYSQVYLRAVTLQHIYLQRLDFEEYGVPHMAAQPFDGVSIKKVIEPISKVVREITPPLPDEVAVPLLSEALAWLDHKAEDVIRLRDVILNYRKKYKTKYARKKFYKELNRQVRAFKFSTLPNATEPWHTQLADEIVEVVTHRADTVIEVARSPLRQARHLILTARDAAFVLLNYLVGLRISEYRSIQVKKNSSLLHGCIAKRRSQGGELEMYFVQGSITKGQEMPVETEWLIGCRPVGADWEPITVRAIGLAKELFAPWKSNVEEYGLFQQFDIAHSLPDQDENVVDVFDENLPLGLRRFVHHQVDLSSLPQQSARGEDLTPYIVTKGRCITTHQGRKTFCAYMLDSRRSLLVPVSRHFHHANTALTEASYYPVLTRLRRELDSEVTANTVRVFEEVMDGTTVLVGKMAAAIDEMCRSEGWAKVRSRRERREAIKATVNLHELRIYFSEYGMCFIKANPNESRCRQAAGKTGWLWDEPAFEYRTPALCSGCGCFAIDPSHLPYWKKRATRPILENTKEFHVLNTQREQAAKVVFWITEALT